MADEPSPPLLRSPPFPGIPVAIAAVSAGAKVVDPPPDDVRDGARVGAVLAAVRQARVGGAFWARPATDRPGMVVRTRRADDRQRLARDAAPGARWIATEDDRPARRRPAADAVDPWSLLGPGTVLLAHGDDEWAAIGELAGADIRLLSPGRFGMPGEAAGVRRRRIAAHLLACRYRNPFSGRSCTLEETLALLALWRDLIAANHRIAAAAGMAWWKRAEIRRFLWAPRPVPLAFRSAPAAIRRAARQHDGVAVWPSRVPSRTGADAAARGVPLIQVEDGFIRSVGLGADLVPPLSVIADPLGIHYDPSRPSELERLIGDGDFPPSLIERAAALRARIVAGGVSKYGGAGDAVPPARRSDRRLVLVPGQVEDDRSVLLGGAGVAGNLDLLRRVRLAEPDAEIWFRPHPDVDAGHRRGGLRDADALAHVDRVVRGGSMAALLALVDAVHVLTSLTGFEALLRGREVACHGAPFFAGWGLTRDLAPAPDRRRRRVSLDELVAATLILYPRYLDPVTMLPCPAETLVSRLAGTSASRPGLLVRLRRLQGRLSRPRLR